MFEWQYLLGWKAHVRCVLQFFFLRGRKLMDMAWVDACASDIILQPCTVEYMESTSPFPLCFSLVMPPDPYYDVYCDLKHTSSATRIQRPKLEYTYMYQLIYWAQCASYSCHNCMTLLSGLQS